MSESISQFPRASFIRRFAAMIYDALIATAVGMCAALAIIAILVTLLENGLLDKQGYEHASELMQASTVYKGVIQAWTLLWIACFFLWFWKNGGQTLGMRAWRLRIFSTNDKSMGYGRACVRMIASLGGLGTLLVLLDWKHKQALQDWVANTEVLHLSVEANDHKSW